MHPSQAARWGLKSEEDIAIAERAVVAARKAGMSEAQIDQLGSYYSTITPALERGQIDAQAALHQLNDYAKLAGVGEEQRAGLLDWHETTSSFMESHPGELPPMSRPSAAAVREERAEIEQIMSTDLPRYQRDEAMQNKYHDLIAASQGEAPPATASKAHMKRLGQLENLMGNPNSEYWRSPAMQAEYRNILDMADPRPAARAAPAAASSGRRAEIEQMVGDQNSAYWRGPRANEIQNEYRGLLAAPEAAAPASTTSTPSTNGDQ